MLEWFRSRLDSLTSAFLEGHGYGAVFEAQFLAYLDGLVASTRGEEAASRVWVGWHEVCASKAAGGPPVCLSNVIQDRQDLVDAMRAFQRQFEGPVRQVPSLAEVMRPVEYPDEDPFEDPFEFLLRDKR